MYVREDAMSLYSLTRRFPTEKDALDHLVRTRWPKGVRCVACNHGKCWPIESTNKTGGPRRLFQCACCKFQFSATTGTLFGSGANGQAASVTLTFGELRTNGERTW